jgi:hypothetical protein
VPDSQSAITPPMPEPRLAMTAGVAPLPTLPLIVLVSIDQSRALVAPPQTGRTGEQKNIFYKYQ